MLDKPPYPEYTYSMNELDRTTRITGYMVVAILAIAIGGLIIPNDPVKETKPVVDEIIYNKPYDYLPGYLDIINSEPKPTPSPTKSIYYPNSYGDEDYVDYDMFDDEDDIESYYEEEN